jgi:hypothetical protein
VTRLLFHHTSSTLQHKSSTIRRFQEFRRCIVEHDFPLSAVSASEGGLRGAAAYLTDSPQPSWHWHPECGLHNKGLDGWWVVDLASNR